MQYKLQKVKNRTQKSYGKYVARVSHHNTITSQQLEKEIERNCSATVADCKLVMSEFAEILRYHLQSGDKVELPYIGTAKIEIISSAVDQKSNFDPERHIKGVRVHIIPQSQNGIIELYNGIKFKKEE